MPRRRACYRRGKIRKECRFHDAIGGFLTPTRTSVCIITVLRPLPPKTLQDLVKLNNPHLGNHRPCSPRNALLREIPLTQAKSSVLWLWSCSLALLAAVARLNAACLFGCNSSASSLALRANRIASRSAGKLNCDTRIELIAPTIQSCAICPLRRSVQSQAKNLVFPTDEIPLASVVNATFLCYLPRNTQMGL